MDDPLFVRGGKTLCDLEGVVDRVLARKRARVETVPERPAVEKLHHHVRGAAVISEIVNGQNIRMGERRDRPGLPFESLPEVRRRSEMFGQDLDRHFAAQARVLRPVHLSHPSRADGSKDFVGTEARAGRQGQEFPRGSDGTRPVIPGWCRRR